MEVLPLVALTAGPGYKSRKVTTEAALRSKKRVGHWLVPTNFSII